MNNSQARKNTLDRIKAALQNKTEIPFVEEKDFQGLFTVDQEDLESRFAIEFTLAKGQIMLCRGKREVYNHLKEMGERKKWTNVTCQTVSLLHDFDLESLAFINNGTMSEADAGITDCEFLVARTGTVVLSSAQSSGRVLPVRVPVHVVIAHVSQLVFGIGEAIDRIKEKFPDQLPSALFFASGPSRTGDIEKTLVVGIHGPQEVYVFLINDRANETF